MMTQTLKPIFSEDYSGPMWLCINKAETIEDLREALYFVCCRLQEFESRFAGHNEAAPESSGNPGELHVEPSKGDWLEAEGGITPFQPIWEYCKAVSAKAYRLAGEREAKG